MSTATKHISTSADNEGDLGANWSSEDLRRDFANFIRSEDVDSTSFELLEARFSSEYTQYSNKPDKVKRMLKDAIDQANIQKLKRLQSEYKSKVNELASFTVFNARDKSDFLTGLEVDTSNSRVVQEKIKNLKTSINKYLPITEAGLKQKDSYFWSTLARLENSQIISRASAQRWKSRYLDSSTQWYVKHGFLSSDFPKYVATWEKIHADKQDILRRVEKSGFSPKDHDDIAYLLSDKYLNGDYKQRASDVKSAEAALTALQSQNAKQYTTASKLLSDAIQSKVLAKHKKGRWLKEVFNDKTNFAEREAFLSSRLPQIIATWAKVKREFDGLTKQAATVPLGTFAVANPDTFLAWHYDARVAYNAELKARIAKPIPDKFDFAIIQKELDKSDFKSALHYIALVHLSTLTAEDTKRLQTMKQFAQTQLQTALHEEADLGLNDEAETNEADSLVDALETARKISPALHALYIAALKQGYGMLTTVSTIAYNGLHLEHKKKVAKQHIKEEQMYQQEAQPIVNQRSVIQRQLLQNLPTENQTHEPIELEDMIEITNEPSVRKPQAQTSEQPKLDVMRISSSGSGVGTIISRCASHQNNGAFLQESMLIIDGVPSTVMRYALQHVHPKITAGARHFYTLSA